MTTPITISGISQIRNTLLTLKSLQERTPDISLGSLEIFDADGDKLGVICDQIFHPGGVSE